MSAVLGAIDRHLRRNETKRQTEDIAAKLRDRPSTAISRVVRDSTASIYEDRLQLLREYRPGGWRPDMNLVGEEHLQNGLARGKGIILWVSLLAYSCHITKKSLNGAGYDVTHLSRSDHGFSDTKLGMRFLNPIQTRIENRFLHERVVIEEEGNLPALMTLHRCLRGNGIVSITVGQQASAFVSAPFLTGTLLFPTGPADLARSSGSVLLPVYTVRDGYWRYTTHIGPPLMSREESAEDAARIYAAWIEPVVRERPAHWRSWDLMRPGDTPPHPGTR